MILVALLYICFTGTVFLDSILMATNPYPLLVAGMRVFFAGIALLGVYIMQHKDFKLSQLKRLKTPLFFMYTFCLYTFSIPAFSWTMKYLDPVKTCFLFVLTPFVTALILYVFYNEKLTRKKLYGLTIGFAAVIPIILATSSGQSFDVPMHLSVIAYCVFVVAIIAFSYGWILNKQLLKTVRVPSSLITGSALTIGGATTLCFFVISRGGDFSSIDIIKGFWWQVAVFILLTAVGYNLYGILLKRYSATFVSFASFLQPAFGLLYAYLFLGQSISLVAYTALGVLLFGLYMFYQEEMMPLD